MADSPVSLAPYGRFLAGAVPLRRLVPAGVFLSPAEGVPLGGVNDIRQLPFEIPLCHRRIKIDAEALLKAPTQDLRALHGCHGLPPG